MPCLHICMSYNPSPPTKAFVFRPTGPMRSSTTNCPSSRASEGISPIIDSSLQSQSSTPTHPWRCLCFGFSEQIIYTCPFPFFPPFLLTDYIALASVPLTHTPSPRTLGKIIAKTYLTPFTKLLHRTPNLHPPNLLHHNIHPLRRHRRHSSRPRRRRRRLRQCHRRERPRGCYTLREARGSGWAQRTARGEEEAREHFFLDRVRGPEGYRSRLGDWGVCLR